MESLSIGEIAARAGLATSAIRYYEKAGLLPRPPRKSGRRVYSDETLDRLALIALARGAGFTIAEIKRLMAGFSRRASPGESWRNLAADKSAELDRRIDEAQRMKQVLDVVASCKCPTMADCMRAIRAATK